MRNVTIKVDAYTREDGTEVSSYERKISVDSLTDDQQDKIDSVINELIRTQNNGEQQPESNQQSEGSTSQSGGGTTTSTDRKPARGSRLFNEPNIETSEIGDRYKKVRGIKTGPGEGIRKLDVERSRSISRAYEEMEHNPDDPEVKAAYAALIQELELQYDAILEAGYVTEMYGDNAEPYKNSAELIEDVRDNKHMWIYPTESGFGDDESGGSEELAGNPLLAPTKFKDANGRPMLANDVFRAVHDFFGHTERGNGFGKVGEENAWDVHARMFSPLARRAMTTETRGQNSWVNFSGENDESETLFKEARSLARRGKIEEAKVVRAQGQDLFKFAPQKTGLLPEVYSLLDEEIEAGIELDFNAALEQEDESDISESNEIIANYQSTFNELQSNGIIPQSITSEQFIALSGSNPEDITEINFQEREDGRLDFDIRTETYRNEKTIDFENKLVIDDTIELNPEFRGNDFSRQYLRNIVEASRAMGFERIEGFGAARLNGEPAAGYYVWPRLGYETMDKDALREYNSYSQEFKDVDSFHELMSTQEGRDYWRDEGRFCPRREKYRIFFDLTDGSRHLEILNA